MSLPTVYPGDLLPTTGELDILPVYPPVDVVLLKSEQVVLGTAYVFADLPVSLSSGAAMVVATISLPAQLVDCVVTFSGVSTVQLDLGTGVSTYASFNGAAPTPPLTTWLPPSPSTDGNPISVPFHGQSANILAGTPITARIYYQVFVPSDITVNYTSVSLLATPTPLL